MKRCCLVGLATAASAIAQDGWSFAPDDETFLLSIRPSLETVVWAADDPPPALFVSDDSVFLDPRLQLEVDASYDSHWFAHATVAADRGFDPVSEESGDIRLDEGFVRWQACDDQRLNIQAGRFATVFGAWQSNHGFFEDPFLLAPLPYSQVIGVNTRSPGAMSSFAIAARADGTAPPASSLDKANWASMVWGPSYATGASLSGSTRHFDYAVEIKNSGLSSHPDSWEENGFGNPSFAGRFGYRPDAEWAFGVSFAEGPWLENAVNGFDRGDLRQTTFGLDARWAHHDWVVTSELVLSEFETPDAGDLRALSGFIGARRKLLPGVWLAARLGGTTSNDARGPAGDDVSWQSDVWRAECAAGWQLTPSLLLKGGYAFTRTIDDDHAGEHVVGLGIGWRY